MSNIWSSIKYNDMQLITIDHTLFTVYTEETKSLFIELAASGLPNPTVVEGEVRFSRP